MAMLSTPAPTDPSDSNAALRQLRSMRGSHHQRPSALRRDRPHTSIPASPLNLFGSQSQPQVSPSQHLSPGNPGAANASHLANVSSLPAGATHTVSSSAHASTLERAEALRRDLVTCF
jgi:hypothetical protein